MDKSGMAAFEAIFNVLVLTYCQHGNCMVYTNWDGVEKPAWAYDYIVAPRIPSLASAKLGK